MQAGDSAFWVAANATSCDLSLQRTDIVSIDAQTGEDGSEEGFTAVFYFDPAIETKLLCYQFSYLDETTSNILVTPTDFILFPTIRVTTIGTMSATPTGTAVGCASEVTVTGAGFAAVNSEPARCVFANFGSTNATFTSDTEMSCETVAPATAGTTTLSLQFGDSDAPMLRVGSTFTMYRSSDVSISTATPGGGSYDLVATIELTGSFFDFGSPRCRFGGNWSGDGGTVTSSSTASCKKPAFPNSAKSIVGAISLEFAPNGQCFAPTAATYVTYNAMVNSLSLSGAPSTAPVGISIAGEGFVPSLAGGRCNFTDEVTGVELFSDLSTTSDTEASCNSPAGRKSATYVVGVQLNGLVNEPTLLGALYFSEYNLSQVKLTGLQPSGGVTNQNTSVTVKGSGFASYGAGQLACRVGTTVVVGELLNSSRVLCPVAAVSTAGDISVSVSLNGGQNGTFAEAQAFRFYEQPTVESVDPETGDADGGTLVTVSGSGFAGLSSDSHDALRCRFGDVTAQSVAATFVSDNKVLCTTLWGAQSSSGQPVSVSLNGEEYTPSAGAPRFLFKGLHPPALVAVYFTTDATLLVIQLDSQPTDRGGANGNVPCERLLSDATAARLQGSSSESAQCGWSDDSTIQVFLRFDTDAAPGMVVTLRDNTIKPKYYTGECAPGQAGNKCNSGATSTMAVNDFFPCDLTSTEETELCIAPVAVLQAPTELSSCPGTSLTLDASQSYGSGIKPLNFHWRTTRECDNRQAIQSLFDQSTGSP